MKRLLLTLISFLCVWQLQAQLKLFVQAESHVGTGWWVHHLGDDPASELSGGYDRSHLALYGMGRVSLGWQFKNWGLSLGVQRGYYDDDELVASADRRGNRTRVMVSTTQGVSLYGGSIAIHRRFQPSPKPLFIQIGGILMIQQVNHIHPDKDRMGLLWGPEWYLNVGFGRHHQWQIGPWLQNPRFGLREARAREYQQFLLLGVKLSYAFFLL